MLWLPDTSGWIYAPRRRYVPNLRKVDRYLGTSYNCHKSWRVSGPTVRLDLFVVAREAVANQNIASPVCNGNRNNKMMEIDDGEILRALSVGDSMD